MAIDQTIEDTADKISKTFITYLEQKQAVASQIKNDEKMAEMMKNAISKALKENGLSQDQAEVLEEAVEEKLETHEKALSQAEDLEIEKPELSEGQQTADLDHGFPEGSIGEALAKEKAAAGISQSQGLGVDIPQPSVSVGR